MHTKQRKFQKNETNIFLVFVLYYTSVDECTRLNDYL